LGGLRRTVRRLVGLADLASGLLLIGITVLNLVAVFMRYVLLDSISWSEEIMRYAGVWLTFLGAAAASWRGEHLSLDLFSVVGSLRFRRLRRALLHALAAVFCAIVLWQGVIYCLKNGMQTAPTTGMLMVYAYGAIAVGAALMLMVELVKMHDAIAGPPDAEIFGEDWS
jgi:TRAP-type C4-dicarboxylate transport system permease small subunit